MTIELCNAPSTTEPCPTVYTASSTTEPCPTVYTAPSTTEPCPTVYTAPSTTESSTTVYTAPSTTESSTTVYTAPSTTEPSTTVLQFTLHPVPLSHALHPVPLSRAPQSYSLHCTLLPHRHHTFSTGIYHPRPWTQSEIDCSCLSVGRLLLEFTMPSSTALFSVQFAVGFTECAPAY